MIGSSIVTIRQWIREGMPAERTEDDKWNFDLRQVFTWRIHKAKIERKGGATDPGTQRSGATRKINAQAEIAELKLLKERGEVVLIEDVGKLHDEEILGLRQRLRTIGARVAPLVLGETEQIKVKAIIDDEVDAALSELNVSITDQLERQSRLEAEQNQPDSALPEIDSSDSATPETDLE